MESVLKLGLVNFAGLFKLCYVDYWFLLLTFTNTYLAQLQAGMVVYIAMAHVLSVFLSYIRSFLFLHHAVQTGLSGFREIASSWLAPFSGLFCTSPIDSCSSTRWQPLTGRCFQRCPRSGCGEYLKSLSRRRLKPANDFSRLLQ